MSYETLLEQDSIKSNYLVVMKPRRFSAASWTNVSGNIYKQSFDYGTVVGVTDPDDEVDLTEEVSSSVGSDEFYYDASAKELYINIGGAISTPVVITYEIYFGTVDADWYRDPLDNSTRLVYFEPLVLKTPEITSSASDVFIGFLPSFSSQISISNATKYLQRHIYDSSFNNAEINIYHYINELSDDSIKLINSGFTFEISSNDSSVDFQVLDATSIFDKEYRHSSGSNFYNTTDFPDLDPRAVGLPIRKFYGLVDRVSLVNIDFNDDTGFLGSGSNRRWVVGRGSSNLGTVTTTVAASPASTSTRTYVTSTDGLNVGDQVSCDAIDPTIIDGRHGIYITGVGSNYIDHARLPVGAGAYTGITLSGGDVITRPSVSCVYVKNGDYEFKIPFTTNEIFPVYGYFVWDDPTTDTWGIEFGNNFEADFTELNQITASSQVYARVYGQKNTVTLGGNPFGSNSSDYGNLTSGAVILFDLLKNFGLSESQIDTTAFTNLQSDTDDEIGFCLPPTATNSFPKYRDIFIKISQTMLIKIYLNNNQKWSVKLVEPITTSNIEVDSSEIVNRSYQYNFNYQEILSTAVVNYFFQEIDPPSVSYAFFVDDVASDGADYKGVYDIQDSSTSYESITGKFLHKQTKEKTFESFHISTTQALRLAKRLSFYFGDRLGKCAVRLKSEFIETDIGDVVEITKKRLPGFEFDENTDRVRDFSVLSSSRSITDVQIEIDDQKGIQDNEADW